MQNCGKLAGYTVFITGASRGIGKAVALKVARDGANVVIAAKTEKAHPKLPGTIHTAAEEVEKAGGKALPLVVDVRKEEHIRTAVDKALKTFGGIDILVNNASAIDLTDTLRMRTKSYDLINQVVARGTYLCSKLCIPHLQKAKMSGRNAHVINMSPPLSITADWFSKICGYTVAKYGVSMYTMGMADEFADSGIAFNSLWPATPIITFAVEMLADGNEAVVAMCRKPEIVADASYSIMLRESAKCSGNFFIDEQILQEEGITDMDQYAADKTKKPVNILNRGPQWWSEMIDASKADKTQGK